MNDGKSWWKSKGAIGGIGTIGVGLAQLYMAATGAEVDIDNVRIIVESTAGVLFGVATTVTGILALWGRIKALNPIRKPKVPEPVKRAVLPWHE